ELEFISLLRDLVPTAESPVVESREVRTPAEVAAVVPTLQAAGTVAVVAQFDSSRATVAHLTRVALAPPDAAVAVVSTPEEPGVLAAVGPLLGDLATAKVGADLKTLRVALARHGIALAGAGFDLSLASYCENPTRPDHGLGALAEELLGQVGVGADPARAALAAHALKPMLEDRIR